MVICLIRVICVLYTHYDTPSLFQLLFDELSYPEYPESSVVRKMKPSGCPDSPIVRKLEPSGRSDSPIVRKLEPSGHPESSVVRKMKPSGCPDSPIVRKMEPSGHFSPFFFRTYTSLKRTYCPLKGF